MLRTLNNRLLYEVLIRGERHPYLGEHPSSIRHGSCLQKNHFQTVPVPQQRKRKAKKRRKNNTKPASAAHAKNKWPRKDAENKKQQRARREWGENANKVQLIPFFVYHVYACVIPERIAAEERQKAKVLSKKAEALSQRQKAEQTIRLRQQRIQAARSAVFSAARRGDTSQVEKGVWEDEVDAAGGEVKDGCDDFVKDPPQDTQETLMHIAAKRGDQDLVKWLDGHGESMKPNIQTITK